MSCIVLFRSIFNYMLSILFTVGFLFIIFLLIIALSVCLSIYDFWLPFCYLQQVWPIVVVISARSLLCMGSMYHVVTMTYTHDHLLGYDDISLTSFFVCFSRDTIVKEPRRVSFGSIITQVQVPLPSPPHPNKSSSQDTVESDHKYQ